MNRPHAALILCVALPALACSVTIGDGDSGNDTSSTSGASTSSETGADATGDGDGDTTDATGDGDGDGDSGGPWGGWDTDGTPESTWCWGSEGPHPQYSFQMAAGVHMLRTPADCAGWFVPGNTYELTVDEVTGTVSVTNEFSNLSHTWDDVEDYSCVNDGTGVDLTVSDDAMNGIEVLIDGTGALDRALVWTGSASGCTLVPV